MKPYFSDDLVTLWHGDALTVLRDLPDQSVNCCVTSPPYFGLRDYGEAGQIGLEASPAEYVDRMRDVFAEVHRVLTDDGTLWLNLGDSYSTPKRGSDKGWDKSRLNNPARVQKSQFAAMREGRDTNFDRPSKSMLGIPWRVAFALQDDGWILRNDIIWAKPNAMPESVTDRLSSRHEHLFLLSKSARYWFDLDPIREPLMHPLAENTVGGNHPEVSPTRGGRYAPSRRDSFARGTKEAQVPGQSTVQHRDDRPNVAAANPLGRNPGDVWTIATRPFAEAHFATMPPELASRCIQSGCPPHGVVLDPFRGSGTTGLAATKHGRRYMGIDLNADYLDLSLRTRLAQGALDFGGVA